MHIHVHVIPIALMCGYHIHVIPITLMCGRGVPITLMCEHVHVHYQYPNVDRYYMYM